VVAIKEWIRRTFCSEELSRDVDGFATDDNDLLPVQQLLGYCASQTTQQVSLAIDHNLLMEASAGDLGRELDRVWGNVRLARRKTFRIHFAWLYGVDVRIGRSYTWTWKVNLATCSTHVVKGLCRPLP
jgi:hypothetical protein